MTTNIGTICAAGICEWSGAPYECGNTGARIYAGYGNNVTGIEGYANAASMSLDSGYTVSNTILYDSLESQRNPVATDYLQILSEEEILYMWEWLKKCRRV